VADRQAGPGWTQFEGLEPEEVVKRIRARDAKSKAVTLAIIGDIPDEDMVPPDDTLFVCKLNPITEDEDLELIFSRFGQGRVGGDRGAWVIGEEGRDTE
jgi:hypothetical protein